MASNYTCVHSESHSYKSNSSSQLYGTTSRRNMGVIVTGPWPMSQPIPPQSLPAKSPRDRKECRSCRLSPHSNSHQGPMGYNHRNSHQNIRPVSMPPSFAMVSPEYCISGESNIELMPLNSQHQHNLHPAPVVPCRASVAGQFNPTSPPTCVPWLKKMKVIKRIQRKIGIGCRGGGMSPNNLPPLLFHSVHGENVSISQNGSVARRGNSFCKAIAFSDRPVKVAEKVCLKFVEVSTNWSGVLRLGFTSHDPSSLKSGLPRYACPDLTSRPGYWAKAFSDFYVKKDAILFYYVNAAGDVHFGINGEEKGVFFSGVDTRGSLWAMLDIYGNTTCVEFVDPRAHLNNSRRSINESLPSNGEEIDLTMSSVVPSLNGLHLEEPPVEPLPDVQYYQENGLQELNFNRIRGRNVASSTESASNIAIRRPGEYCNAYVFTARPIQPGETVIVQVLHQDTAYTSSMAFGLTSCDPQRIRPESLPEDSHLLLDRSEYWVVKKDVANNPSARDVLAFSVSCSGEVTMTKNEGLPIVLMHVDNSVPLWVFFDLYGTTDKIRLVGSLKQRREVYMRHGRTVRELSNYHSRTSIVPFSSSVNGPSASKGTTFVHEYLELSHSPNSMGDSLQVSRAPTAAFSANSEVKDAQPSSSTSQKLTDLSNWSVECVACCERPVDSVFYSCGHMCMCYGCAVEYWKTKEKGCCPICRAAISDVIRTYKS